MSDQLKKDIDELHKIAEEYEKTPEYPGFKLRLDVAEMVLKAMKAKDLTCEKLAEMIDVDPDYIAQMINAERDYTLQAIGEVMWHLDILPMITIVSPEKEEN